MMMMMLLLLLMMMMMQDLLGHCVVALPKNLFDVT